jgi:hypothetical protein
VDRRFRWLAVLTFVDASFLPRLANSGPRDAAATKLADDAINNDYLATNFAEAEKKLRSGIKMCGGNACSAQTVARLHRDLGVVLVAGMNRPDDGKKEFGEALKADPNIALEKDLVTPEVEAAFQAAKGGGAAAPAAPATPAAKPGKSAAPAGGDMVLTAPAEQVVLTPVPIYVELPDGVNAVKVLLISKAFGATEWKKLELKKIGNGYGAEIKCEDVGSATGDLSFYIQASDASGDVVSNAGTRNAPNKVAIKNQIDGEPPHLPGKPAPAKCVDAGDCPPGFPCEKKKKKSSGGLGWGDACTKDSQCTEGLACKNGQCEIGEKSKDEEEDEPATSCETNADCSEGETCSGGVCEGAGGAMKKIWISASIQPDVSLVSSQDNVCGSAGFAPPGSFACFNPDDTDYLGVPEDGAVGQQRGNAVKGGPHLSSIRVLLGIDFLAAKNISLGARVGYATNSMPGQSLSMFHLEARATYWLGKNPFKKTSLRPYVAAIGGLAQMNDKFTVTVRECQAAPMSSCAQTRMELQVPQDLPPQQDLTVWHRTGGAFAGLAGGVMIPVGPKQGVLAELKLQGLFPKVGFAVSPSVGYAFGF